MEEEFKDELQMLIEHLLTPERLTTKKFSGVDLKGSEYMENIKNFLRIFQSNYIPSLQFIYESTVEMQMNILINNCVEIYRKTMLKNHNLITNEAQIPIFHNSSKNLALDIFNESKKMGSARHAENSRKILSEKIEKLFSKWSGK